MTRRSGGAIRGLLVPTAVALGVAIIGAVLLWIYIPERERALRSLSYDALSDAELETKVDAIADALATRAKGRCSASKPKAGTDLCDIPGLVALDDGETQQSPLCLNASKSGDESRRVRLSLASAAGSAQLYFTYPLKLDALCGRLDLRSLLPRSNLFDAVVLARESDGTVLHQEGLAETPLTTLGGGAAADSERSDGGHTATTASVPAQNWRTSLSTDFPVSIAGKKLLLFCRALTGALAPEHLVVCGLRHKDAFQADARRMPALWLALLASLLLLATLSWPLLKLRFLGPRERLTPFDVRMLVACCLAGTGMVCALLLALQQHLSVQAALDARLAQTARRASRLLRKDLRTAREHLKRVRSTLQPGERSIDGPENDVLWITHYQNDGAPFPQERWWKPHQRSNGTCQLKRIDPPSVNLSDEPFFLGARTGRVTFGVLRSKYTSGIHAVIAMPAARGDRSKGVVTMSIPLLAFLQPVAPKGVGFALVNRNGDALTHSSPERALTENLTLAAGGDRRLAAATWAHVAAWVDADYGGTPHRFVVVPLPVSATGEPMSVVAFRELLTPHTLMADTLSDWFALFLTYLVILILLLVGVRMFAVETPPGGYRAGWLWPDRRPGMCDWYLRATALVASTGAISLSLLTDSEGASTLPLLWLLPIVTVALLRLHLATAKSGASPGAWFPSILAAGGLLTVVLLLAREQRPQDILVVLLLAAMWLGARPSSEPSRRTPDAVVGMAAAGLTVLLLRRAHPVAALVVSAILPIWWMGWLVRPTDGGGEEGRFRSIYVAMLVTLLGVLAVIPSIVLFRDAHHEVFARFVRNEQLAFKDARDDRQSTGVLRTHCGRQNRSNVFPPTWPTGKLTTTAGDCARRRVAGWMLGNLPAYSELAARLRVIDDEPGESAFTRPPGLGTSELLVILGILAGSFALLSWVTRRLFLLDADAHGVRDIPVEGRRSIWVLVRPRKAAPELFIRSADDTWFDLQQDGSLAALSRARHGLNPLRGVVRIDHLECRLGDRTWEEEVLSFLEGINPDQEVVVASHCDPIAYMGSQLHDEPTSAGAAKGFADDAIRAVRFERWVQVLECFEVQRHDAEPPGDHGTTDSGEPTRVETDDTTDDRSQARHWQLWSRCSRAEKLALHQLAEEGFLSPASVDVVHGLMRRGLVRREPELCLMTPSFRRFVLRADPRETVTAWESEADPSSWPLLRLGLTGALTLGGLVLVVTQPEFLQSTAAAVTALAAAIPVLLRLLGVVGRDSPQPAAK